MMKLNIIFLVCVAGMFNVGHGAAGKRHPVPENDRSRRSNGKSLYRRPEYDNEKDKKSAKQRREVGGVQKRSCDEEEFQCADGSFVSGCYHCDLYVDCPDESDELDCAATSDDIDYCGWNNYIAQTRIINGVDTNIEEWPWQVMLLKKTNSYYHPYYFKCGGTLISDRHVLTAAHCVDKGDASEYQIALGKNYTSLKVNEGIRRNVVILAIHEGFSRNSYGHDIAVLTLDAPVTIPNSHEDLQNKFSINTACVDHPGNHWDENDKCFITGYGHLNGTTEQKSERLQEAKINYMDHVDCEANTNFKGTGQLSPTMICGGDVDGTDSCQGDSGGPLVCRHSMLNYYVVGITSFGKGCGEEGWPGVYTSVKSYSTWIMDNML